jgi:hypothetical protein
VQDKTGSFVKPLAARKNRHWGGMWRYFFEKKYLHMPPASLISKPCGQLLKAFELWLKTHY